MPTVQVDGLEVLAVHVASLEAARSFYAEHLGFEVVQEMPPGVLMKAGDVTIYLEGGRDRRVVGGPAAEVSPCLALKGDGVRSAWEKLSEAGVTIVAGYTEHAPTFAMFRFADPDGNAFEIAGPP